MGISQFSYLLGITVSEEVDGAGLSLVVKMWGKLRMSSSGISESDAQP